jgi:hypothetical protein
MCVLIYSPIVVVDELLLKRRSDELDVSVVLPVVVVLDIQLNKTKQMILDMTT